MKVTKIFTMKSMKSMKDLKKKLHGLHVLHGNLLCFVVPVRAWVLLKLDGFVVLRKPQLPVQVCLPCNDRIACDFCKKSFRH